MGKKNGFNGALGDLYEERKKVDKKIARISVGCSHTNSNGKAKLEYLNNGNVRCKKCGKKFNFNAIEADTLHAAVKTLQNAINQIKTMTDDPEREAKVINLLGEMDFNIQEVETMYGNVTGQYKKKKNKNRNKYDDMGAYGSGNVSFLGGGKKKKY